MATQETQKLDSIIASRRALLVGGGASLAALALAPQMAMASSPATISDTDILNFALNLEYLEANFYYLAAFGTTINTPNTFGAPTYGIDGSGTAGTVAVKANAKVPFALPAIAAYAFETAVEEGKHVNFLRTALGSSKIAQPAIDLTGGAGYGATAAWNALANAAGLGLPNFDPFASDANFLLAAYVFEDVGVTAYHGAAPSITDKKVILPAAVGIHAVEAYHAGLVRTSILSIDAQNGNTGLQAITQKISLLRTTLAKAVAPASGLFTYPTSPATDDFGVSQTNTVTLGGASATTATQIVDADPTNVMGFGRTTSQVINIVTGGGYSATAVSKGVFFPAGLNGNIN